MIGVIGCGTMAQAIVKSFYRDNNDVDFLTYTPSHTRAEQLALAVKGRAARNLSEFSGVGTLIIGCKPQQLAELCQNIATSKLNLENVHIISILAATPIEILEQKLGSRKISRVMPNTPSLLGLGISLTVHGKGVLESDKQFVQDFFTSCGEVSEMAGEEIFDQVTTVSGSGPAYVFLFAQILANQLKNWGLAPDKARKIVNQLFLGSSQLMREQENLSLDELIANVTSKGGVTIEAVNSFRKDGIESMTARALGEALERSKELKKGLGCS